MVHGGEKTPLRNKFAFRVRSEERRNLLFILFRLHAACGIKQMSARFDQTDLCVQNLLLQRGDFIQTFCIEAAQGVRSAAVNSAFPPHASNSITVFPPGAAQESRTRPRRAGRHSETLIAVAGS